MRADITVGRRELLIAGAGVLSGGFAAVAYYTPLLRSLPHSFGIWIVLVVVVTRRQEPAQAVVRAVIALESAVVAFYVGKAVCYGIKYPGMPYGISTANLAIWSVLAALAGVLFGLSFRLAGRDDRWGVLATAAIVGLLLGDAFRQIRFAPADEPALTLFTVAAVSLVLWLGSRSPPQLFRISALAIPLTVVGFVVATAPDLLEQLIFTGSFSGILFHPR